MDRIGHATICARSGVTRLDIRDKHVTNLGIGGTDLDAVVKRLHVHILNRVVASVDYDSC